MRKSNINTDYMSKWSYNPAESIEVKKFHMTPDRVEFLSVLTSKYPNETSFTKEMIDETDIFHIEIYKIQL